jgi:heme A synthase
MSGLIETQRSAPPVMLARKPTFIQTYQDTTVSNLNLAFSLASALAWNEAIKSLVNKYVISKNMQFYHVLYALVVTLIAVMFMIFTKRSKTTTKVIS